MRRPPDWPRPGLRPGGHPSHVGRPWPTSAARLIRRLGGVRGGWWPGHRPAGNVLRHPVLSSVGGLGVLLVFTWGAVHSPLLDVDRIEILGSAQVPPERALAAAGISPGVPLMAIDPGRGAARLEALPWVRRAQIRRVFPNFVRIVLEERRAAASAARPAGGFALLDDTGRVLAEASQRPDGVPEVTGVAAPPRPGAWLPGVRPVLQAVSALPDGLRREVATAGLAAGGVTLRLPAVSEVRLGPPRELAAKAAALASLLERLDGRPVAYIDLQVPSAPVVGPMAAPPPASRPAPAAPASPARGTVRARD